jgi:DNA-binding response OmpR family regulator
MKHIIIIDDEIDIGESLATVLESEGYMAEAYSNGYKGLEYMKTKKPDLVIVDVMMPKPKGVEVVRLLKEDPELKNVPIMMMSASKEPLPLTEEKWDAFVRKPFEMDELLTTIDDLLV